MLTRERIKEKLIMLHEQENGFNGEMGKIDKQIQLLAKRKEKLARMVSKNMKHRNQLIEML